jgi:hypothetical protein
MKGRDRPVWLINMVLESDIPYPLDITPRGHSGGGKKMSFLTSRGERGDAGRVKEKNLGLQSDHFTPRLAGPLFCHIGRKNESRKEKNVGVAIDARSFVTIIVQSAAFLTRLPRSEGPKFC